MKLLVQSAMFILLALRLASPVAIAQEPATRVYGAVTDENGALVPDAVITVKKSVDAKFSGRNLGADVTDDKGRYSIKLPAGEYSIRVITSSDGMTYRNDNLALQKGQELKLDIQICYGGCEAEQFDALPTELTDAYKKEIINQTLQHYFITSWRADRNSSRRKKLKLVLSTKNIKAEWIKTFPNLKFTLVSPDKIRKETKKDYFYCEFTEIKFAKKGIVVLLENAFALSRQSGGGRYYLFQKKEGNWIGRPIAGWVS
jgi:hypothetical protein